MLFSMPGDRGVIDFATSRAVLEPSYTRLTCMLRHRPDNDVDFDRVGKASLGTHGRCQRVLCTTNFISDPRNVGLCY